jgi:hypothetical protein
MLMRSALLERRSRIVENLATNPAFRRVGGGTFVTARRNVFPNPRMERAVAGTTAVRRNLFSNPAPSGISGGFAATRMTTTDGGGFVRHAVTDTALGANAQRWAVYPGNMGSTNGAPCTPYRTYAVSFDVRTERAHQLRLVGLWNPGAGYQVVSGAATIIDATPGAWQRASIVFIAPAGAARVGYEMGFNDVFDRVMGETVDVRRVLIEERPAVLPYFDGGTTNDRGITYEWEATANGSASIARALTFEVFRNIHRNPGARNPSGADFTNWAGPTPNAITPSAPDVTWSRSGKAYQVTWTNADNADNGDIGVALTQVTADQQFTVEYDIVSSRGGELTIPQPFSPSGVITTQGRSHTTSITVAPGAVTRRWATFTADAAAIAAGARIVQTVTKKQAGDYLQISNAVIYAGPKRDNAWFDGYSTPDADLTPAWTGTPDASASILQGVRVEQAVITGQAVTVRSWNGGARIIPVSSSSDTSMRFSGEFSAFQFGMMPGRTYTALGRIRVLVAQAGATTTPRRMVLYYLLNGNYVPMVSEAAPNVPGVYDLRFTFTVPPTTQTFLRLFNGASVTDPGSVVWERLNIIEGRYDGTYFDGDTTDDSGMVYGWESTAHSSASTIKAALVEVRRNVATDPGCRNASIMWRTRGGTPTNPDVTTSYIDATWATSGRAFRVAGSSTSTYLNVEASPTPQEVPISAGQVWTVTAKVRSDVSRQVIIRLRMLNGGGDLVSSLFTIGPTAQEITSTFTIPAGATPSASFTVITSNNTVAFGAGNVFEVGDPVIEQSPISRPYFDGAISQDADLWPSFVGADSGSDSILSGISVNQYGYNSTINKAVQSTGATPESKAIRLINTSMTSKDTFANASGDVGGLRLGMLPGRTYTALATVRYADARDSTNRPGLRAYTRSASGGGYVTTIADAPLVPGRYVLRVTFTLPVDASEAFIRLYNGGFATAGDVWFENFLLIDGKYDGAYFDGNSPRVVWRGVPNVSTSTGYPAIAA